MFAFDYDNHVANWTYGVSVKTKLNAREVFLNRLSELDVIKARTTCRYKLAQIERLIHLNEILLEWK